MSIGLRIKKLREQKKMSQTELAKKIGIHSSTICGMESGKSIRSTKLTLIASALGVSPLWLQTGEGEPHKTEEKKYHAETESVIELMESTDDIGRGKALYAVKEVIELRSAITKIKHSFDEHTEKQPHTTIANWDFNVNSRQNSPYPDLNPPSPPHLYTRHPGK